MKHQNSYLIKMFIIVSERDRERYIYIYIERERERERGRRESYAHISSYQVSVIRLYIII